MIPLGAAETISAVDAVARLVEPVALAVERVAAASAATFAGHQIRLASRLAPDWNDRSLKALLERAARDRPDFDSRSIRDLQDLLARDAPTFRNESAP